MGRVRILLVGRSPVYSPGNVANDAAILEAVAAELRKRGCETYSLPESDVKGVAVAPDIVAGMYRSQEALDKVAEFEAQGVVTVNTSLAVKNCNRTIFTEILQREGIPVPSSISGRAAAIGVSPIRDICHCGCWVKSGDGKTTLPGDVVYAPSPEETMKVLSEKGDERVIVSEHLRGDLVKFYGTGSGRFFRFFYVDDIGKSKFGLESVNGAPLHIPFDETLFRNDCFRAAHTIGTHIFGGDAVVCSDGTVRIIDFNDWPSFSPCREEAAAAIAEEILSHDKGAAALNTQDACGVLIT